MAGYLGQKPAVNGIYTVDEFTSSGGTTYTLSRAPGTKNNIQVNAGGLAQYPSAYSVSGTTLTLSGVPSGQKVVVRHMGETILYPALDDNIVTNAKLADDAVGLAELSATGTASSSNFLRGDNSWQEAGGGAWNFIGTAEASATASLTITGLDSTYDTYAIGLSGFQPVTNAALIQMRFGDSSGIDSGAADYDWHVMSANAALETRNDSSDLKMDICHQDGIQSGAGDGYGAMLYIHNPSDSTVGTIMSGTAISGGAGTNRYTHVLSGQREHVIAHDRVQIFFSTGNIAIGRMTIWGIAHA